MGQYVVRQVNHAELLINVRFAMRKIKGDTRKGLSSRETGTRKMAEDIVAGQIVQMLGRYEILSSAPVPEGADLFSAAAYGGGARGSIYED